MRALFGVGSVAAMVVVDAIVAATPNPSNSVAHALPEKSARLQVAADDEPIAAGGLHELS